MLNWAGFDMKTIGVVPTNGTNSLLVPAGTSAVNSPTNFAGTAGSVTLPTGDYNHNGKVDAADYTLWRDSFGRTVTAGHGADGNANGTIDNADYAFWKSHFGNSVSGSGVGAGWAAAAPEPSTAILFIMGFSVIWTIIRRGRLR
jgi:dockerin type I repeat protein